jgi:hypothetical protein
MQASLRSLHKFGCAPRLEGWPRALMVRDARKGALLTMRTATTP